MTLADDLAEAVAETVGPKCGVGAVLDALDDDDRQVLVEWLARPKREVPGTKIGKVLRGRGHKVSDESVARHRRKACHCDAV